MVIKKSKNGIYEKIFMLSYMPICRELNSMKNGAFHLKNSDCVHNLWIKNWMYHCPDRCPDKSPDLLKRMQKCPQERRLERERSRSRERYITYDFLGTIMSLWCPYGVPMVSLWWKELNIYCIYFIYVTWSKHPI